MPGDLHGRMVADLVAQGAETHGFTNALKSLVRGLGYDVSDEDWALESLGFRRIPDAYRIDASARIVTAFEVVVTHRVSARKLRDYGALFWLLDEVRAEIVIVEVDRYGVRRALPLPIV
jgi:hypothetical protein